MQRSVGSIAVGLLVIGLLVSTAAATVPVLIGHSGRLLGSDDTPISGTVDITYAIFETSTGGTALWTEVHPGVAVTDGLFSATLGSIVPLTTDIVAGGGGGGAIVLERYLEVRIGGDPPISPRTRLAAAPYAVAAGRVDGDIKTGPGIVVVGDTLSDNYATFGERVQAGLHAAGSAIASGATLITSECDSGEGSARLAINTKGTGAKRTGVVMEALPDSAANVRCEHDNENDGLIESTVDQSSSANSAAIAVKASKRRFNLMDAFPQRIDMRAIADDQTQQSWISQTSDSDGDGVPEVSASSHCDTAGTRLVMEKKGINAVNVKLARAISSMAGGPGAADSMEVDADDDGVMDRGVVSGCDAAGARHAIKTKGTGAASNRVLAIQSGATPSELSSSATIDDDGDTVPESEISESVTPSTAYHAIKTKGTGADANRVLVIQSGATPSALSNSASIDDDGDTVPESEISESVTPSTSYHAIKTKGTGAESNRVVTISSTTSSSGAICGSEFDDDGDTIPESSVATSCDASTAKIVVDRDSGRSKARISASSAGSSVVLEGDLDGDGLNDRSVTSSIDSAQAEVVASEGDTEVSLRTRKGGIIKGVVTINHASAMRVELTADGDGYLHNSLGIGVAAAHRIDVAGGAYCDGTDWVNASDANAKENFEKVSGAELLDQIADLEISKWNYRGDEGSQHIGPTAQDFQKVFGVGSDGKSISTIDPSGIALAAIKELYTQLKQKDQEVEALRQELAKLRRELKK